MLARRIVFAVSIFLNLVLFYNLIWGESGAIAYQELRERYDTLEARIRQADAENLELTKEISLLRTDEKYLEKVIRNRLNYVRENEILYIFPETDQAETAGAPPDEAKD